ncbi:MAG: DUF4349 domain-containing protein [Planctomycetota bacterium]
MTTTNCLQFEELIETYLAQGLSGAELAEFEAHKAICDVCRKSLDEARRFGERVLQALIPHRVPDGLEGRMVDAFRIHTQAVTRRRNIGATLRRLAYISAAALVLIAVGVFVMTSTLMSTRYAKTRVPTSMAPSDKGYSIDNYVGVVEAHGVRKQVGALGLIPHMSEVEVKEYYGDNIYNSSTAPVTDMPSGQTTQYYVRVQNDGNTSTATVVKPSDKDNWNIQYYNNPDEKGYVADSGIIRGDVAPVDEVRKRDLLSHIHDALDIQIQASEAKNANTSVWTGTEVRIFPAPPPAVGEALNVDRKIVKTGTLTFEVDSFEAAYQKVVAILTEEKGYIASSGNTKLPNGKVKGQIVIRVLPDKFDAVTLKLRALGELKNQQVTSEDITKQYVDLLARLKNSRALEERLIKLMSEKKGEIKDLLEVEKELANTREKIERLQGEIKYFDNLTALATITLDITEKDFAKPFEYVQTQSANLTLAVSDVEIAYQKAQAIVHALKGQIVEGNVTNQDRRLNGIVKAYSDAEQFTALLDQLKGLGEVKLFNASQKQTSSDGAPVGENTPVRKERGLVTMTIIPPAGEYVQTKRSQVILETPDVDNTYSKAQSIAAEAQAKVLNGAINRSSDRISAVLILQVDPDRFRAVVDNLKGLGKVKNAAMDERQQAQDIDPKSNLQTPVRKEPAIIELTINSPLAIVTEESGVSATIKDTLKGSIKGLLWSLEMLIVGFISIAPWLTVALLVYVLYRRMRRKSA